jgi:hypothetical protein
VSMEKDERKLETRKSARQVLVGSQTG